MSEKLDKLVEELSTLSVLEAADLVKKLEEKTEFDVVIKDPGAKKIDVIKVIRQLTNLGLGEAKTMAETAGAKVLTGAGKDAANDAKKRLEEAGASIVLE